MGCQLSLWRAAEAGDHRVEEWQVQRRSPRRGWAAGAHGAPASPPRARTAAGDGGSPALAGVRLDAKGVMPGRHQTPPPPEWLQLTRPLTPHPPAAPCMLAPPRDAPFQPPAFQPPTHPAPHPARRTSPPQITALAAVSALVRGDASDLACTPKSSWGGASGGRGAYELPCTASVGCRGCGKACA